MTSGSLGVVRPYCSPTRTPLPGRASATSSPFLTTNVPFTSTSVIPPDGLAGSANVA